MRQAATAVSAIVGMWDEGQVAEYRAVDGAGGDEADRSKEGVSL